MKQSYHRDPYELTTHTVNENEKTQGCSSHTNAQIAFSLNILLVTFVHRDFLFFL